MQNEISKYNFSHEESIEFEITDLRELFLRKQEMMTKIHRAGFYQIVWFQYGSSKHMIDYTSVNVEPGSLIFINKDSILQYDSENEFGGKIIFFTESFFAKTIADLDFLRKTIFFDKLLPFSESRITDKSVFLTRIFEDLETEFTRNKDRWQEFLLKNMLHNLILFAERERSHSNFTFQQNSAELDCVLEFRNELEIDFRKEKMVSYYANKLGVTEKKLNLATSKILGKTPKSIIDERIMLEAKRMLNYSSDSVKEICYSLGFEEPTNFNKYFRKHEDMTPKQFRLISRMA
ncbi:MAG: helix-turn-helix domain-containing protein [Weeksellaceae bacterium]|nr:helix-turn-helix domain-containing protein [Weeksellaceae bacterium]